MQHASIRQSARNAALLGLLAATACAPADGPTPDQNDRKKAAQTTSLSGQWQVNSLNGKPLDPLGPPIFLSVNRDKMIAISQCVWWHWVQRADGSAFSAKPAQLLTKSEDGKSIPQAMCARGFSRQEEEFARAVTAANQIAAPTSDARTLSGSAGTVALKRRPGIEGNWQLVAINGRPLPADHYPVQLFISELEIAAMSQCVGLYWTYRREGSALSTRPARLDGAICERSRTPTELELEAVMGKVRTWRTLTDAGLYFQTGKETLTLQPQP